MADRRVMVLLDYDPNTHPGLTLRAQATAAFKLSPDGTRWEWRCPFCGSRARGKVRPGQVAGVRLEHEPWCPVLTNEEVTR